MGEIVNLGDNRPHIVQEVICVKCAKRWISCSPLEVKLKDYECPNCGQGHVIKTGQELE